MKQLILLIMLASSIKAMATDLEIIDVKRNIPLSETDPIYKDYYIKTNGQKDLKKNLVVKATRQIQVKDSTLKAVGDFKTPVGLVKIIQVSDTIAVAREFKTIPRDQEAMIEQVGIMVGDQIDLADSFVDEKK